MKMGVAQKPSRQTIKPFGSMEELKFRLATLPTVRLGKDKFLSYQAVTNQVAAFLLPGVPADEIGGADYQHILETADTLCRELGYTQVVKLTPPDVPLNQMGLYWSKERQGQSEPEVIIAGPGRVEALQDGHLLDARLSSSGFGRGHPAALQDPGDRLRRSRRPAAPRR